MKKIMILLLLLCLVSCDDFKDSFKFEDYVTVSSPMDNYTMAISSVPGLPLDVEILKDAEDISFEVTVDRGELLNWDRSNIEILGQSTTLDFEDSRFYWSPREVYTEPCQLVFHVLYKEEVIYEKNYSIVFVDQAYQLMHIVLTD